MKKSHKKIQEYRKLAKISMFVGLSLLIISTAISFIFIKPSNFKDEFRKRQLGDCLNTETDSETCYKKFGE